jgi:ubiquinone/menaquinone biosynthesis C-methylase UbiE
MHGKGLVADLGCGPGHIAKYLQENGVQVFGIDLSPGMIRCARRMCPDIEFRVGDMASLDIADESLVGIVAFYSIVHFESSQLTTVFKECRRVLSPGGLMLLAFHIGDEIVHADDLWGQQVNLDFRFHQPCDVKASLLAAHLTVIESAEREPYEGAEHQSRRAYLLARAD